MILDIGVKVLLRFVSTLLNLDKKGKLMGWSLIFVSALYHRLSLQNVGRFRLRQSYVGLTLLFSLFLTFTFGSSFSSAVHSAPRGQNLYDGLFK